MRITNKTVIYRFLKKKGIPYADAYAMTDELLKLIEQNIQDTESQATSEV